MKTNHAQPQLEEQVTPSWSYETGSCDPKTGLFLDPHSSLEAYRWFCEMARYRGFTEPGDEWQYATPETLEECIIAKEFFPDAARVIHSPVYQEWIAADLAEQERRQPWNEDQKESFLATLVSDPDFRSAVRAAFRERSAV